MAAMKARDVLRRQPGPKPSIGAVKATVARHGPVWLPCHVIKWSLFEYLLYIRLLFCIVRAKYSLLVTVW